jgi:HD-GYP domain-containing protein (c-di-GMP phosphodiesterase class II)
MELMTGGLNGAPRAAVATVALGLAAVLGAACGSSSNQSSSTSPDSTTTASELAPIHGPYRPRIDPADFVSTIDNSYFPLLPGTGFHYRGVAENGKTPQTDDMVVTHKTKMSLGVKCTVVRDTVSSRGKPIERTFDWYAQDKGEQIPMPMRIVHVAMDAAFQCLLGGQEHAERLVRERAGHAFDPQVAACLVEEATEILALDASASAWEEVLALEPSPPLVLGAEALDRALAAMGNFADLISPFLAGHSAGVGELAGSTAEACGIDATGVTAIRRAALLHDLGRVAVHARIWQKLGPLTADEWEQVRLHPYHTERVLSRSPFLSALSPIAGAHHERIDGSGYHRGAAGPELAFTARLLAAADAYHAMTEPRPHRDPLPPGQAAQVLAEEASAGRLDPDAVAAVLEAAGQRAPRLERPAGLTDREAEVVAMLARGLQTKQVARALGISVKTADRHIQNAYRKIGVSSRAAATLFAMEHGLVTWGELPIAHSTVSS